MPEGAVAAPTATPVATPVESSASVSSPVSSGQESSQSTIETQGKEPVAGQEAAKPGATRTDINSVIKDPAKREALKAIDPSLPGLLRDAAHGAQELKKQFPGGGLKEAMEYRDTLKSLGGAEAVKEIQSEHAGFNNLDKLYTEGNVEFVQQIQHSDPEAFERMVPLALETFGKNSPEMYQHVMSRIVMATLDDNGFSRFLESIKGKGDEGTNADIERLLTTMANFRQISAKIPEKKIDPERAKLDNDRQEFQQQKTREMEASVNRRSTEYRDGLIARELKPHANWQDLDEDRKEAVVREFKARSAKLVNADEDFKRQRARLLQNGDGEGVAKLEKNWLDTNGPTIVSRVAKLFWSNPGKPAPKPVAAVSAKSGQRADTGFKIVDKLDNAKVDKTRTTHDMVFAGKAIYTDGTKVQLRA